MMTNTDALVKGLNPFDFALQPYDMNQYGIVYPLLVWPLAKLFGTTMLVHRLVTGISILAIGVLIFLAMQRLKVPLLLNIWAVEMLYASLLYPGTSTPTIDPGATATLFFLLTIFVPWFCRYSYKSLLVSAVFALLGFYAKPYALLGAGVITVFVFFFVSKMKGFIYGVIMLLAMIISVVFFNHYFPAYFDDCFFTSANQAASWASTERLDEQLVKYWQLHEWVFILMAAVGSWYLFKSFRQKKIESLLKSLWDGHSIAIHVFAAICSALVLYTVLGRHTGAMYWYFFQLLSPFVLIIAVWTFKRTGHWPLLCAPLLVLTLRTMSIDADYKIFAEKTGAWPYLAQVVGRYEHVLNSPLIAPLLIQQNKDIVDNGQAEYFGYGGQRASWMKGFFKEDRRVYILNFLFFKNIREDVENKRYGLIALQPGLMPEGVGNDIKKYYQYEGQAQFYAVQDRRSYPITLWKPL